MVRAWAFLLCVCGISSCGHLHWTSSRRDGGLSDDAESQDNEQDVARLASQLQDFNHWLNAKNFDEASRSLRSLEKGVRQASGLTRSHPDFEDLAADVKEATQRLRAATEQDRLEKRDMSVDRIISRGDVLIKQSLELQQTLRERAVSQDDIATLTSIDKGFAELERDGSALAADPRYQSHAAYRSRIHQMIQNKIPEAQWQWSAAQTVGAPVAKAVRAALAAQNAATLGEQASGNKTAAAEFRNCKSAVDQIALQPGTRQFRGSLLIQTDLGFLSLSETQERCRTLGNNAEQRYDAFQWEKRILDVLSFLEQKLANTRQANSTQEAIAAYQAALSSLSEAQLQLQSLLHHPAMSNGNKESALANKEFSTSLGQFNLRNLLRACTTEHARLARGLPILHWHKQLDDTQQEFSTTYHLSYDAVLSNQTPAERAAAWTQTLKAIDHLSLRLRAIGASRDVDANYAIATPAGVLTLAQLIKNCEEQRKQAEDARKQALSAGEVETFVATCHGDEIRVAQLLGIPKKIIQAPGAGRIFDYGNGQVFGFDTRGNQQDFWGQWRAQVQTLIASMDNSLTTLGTVHGNTAEQLRATEATLLELTQGRLQLSQSLSHPGYSASAKFLTRAGDVPFSDVGKIYLGQEASLQKRIATLRWQIAAEAVYARADAARLKESEAYDSSTASNRLELLNTAIAAFAECQEQSAALARDDSANKQFKSMSSFGTVDILALEKACQNAKQKSQRYVFEQSHKKELSQ